MDFQEMLLSFSVRDRLFLVTVVVFVLALVGSVITEKKIDKNTTVDKYGFACTTAPLFFGSVFSIVFLVFSVPALLVQILIYISLYIFPVS